MAFDVAPMPEVFQACYDVLQVSLRPIRYTELTQLALQRIHVSPSSVNWHRQIEDVREKMLLKGQHDSFYLRRPFCLAGLRRWFETPQFRLFQPTDGIYISGDVSCGIQGAFEALMRNPYMQVKAESYRNAVTQHFQAFFGKFTGAMSERNLRYVEDLMLTRARGLVIEQHVKAYFAKQYPAFYEEPSNFRKWHQKSDEDFFLRVNGRRFAIDVSAQRLKGGYGKPQKGKHPVDFHLMCDVDNDRVRWISVVPKGAYAEQVFPEHDGMSPERMLVWLNCLRDGLPYGEIRRAVMRTLRAQDN